MRLDKTFSYKLNLLDVRTNLSVGKIINTNRFCVIKGERHYKYYIGKVEEKFVTITIMK